MVYREHCRLPGTWVWVHGGPPGNRLGPELPGAEASHAGGWRGLSCVPLWEERGERWAISPRPRPLQGPDLLSVAVINLRTLDAENRVLAPNLQIWGGLGTPKTQDEFRSTAEYRAYTSVDRRGTGHRRLSSGVRQGFALPPSAHPEQHPLWRGRTPVSQLQLTHTDSAERLGCQRPSLVQEHSPPQARQVWPQELLWPQGLAGTPSSPWTHSTEVGSWERWASWPPVTAAGPAGPWR